MEMWVRPVGAASEQGALRANLMGTIEVAPVNGQFFAYFEGDNTTGSFKVGWVGGVTLTVPITNFLRGSIQNPANHLVVVWSFTTLKVYVQGVLVASTPATPPAGPNYTTLGFPFCLLGTDRLLISCAFDEAAFYTYELNAARVLVHYQNGIAPIVP
jgi:hypothetical protein